MFKLFKKDQGQDQGQDHRDESGTSILQEAIDAFPYPFYIIDVNTYTIEVANKFLGIDLENEEGEIFKCHKVTHRNELPCSGDKDPCPIREMRKTKAPVSVEHIHFDKEGVAKNVRVHAFPIFDENGEIKKMIEYSIDITREKAIEKKANRHAKELKRLNELMMGRELKMIELKKEIEELKKKREERL